MSLTRLNAGILACSALLAPLSAQGKPFKHALPAKTLMFVSAPDLNASAGEFQSTALAKMWREEEVQDFVKDALVMAKEKWKQGLGMLAKMHKDGQIPFAPEDVAKLRINSLTAAMTTFEIKAGDAGPKPKIGVLVHADFGEGADTARKLVDFGLGALIAQSQGQVDRTSTKLDGDVELITLNLPGGTDMSLNVAFVGSGMIVGTLTDEVKAAVSAVLGQKTILPKDPDYMATAKHLSGVGAEIEGYVHFSGYLDVMMGVLEYLEGNLPNWPPEFQVKGFSRALTALGARSIRATGFTSKYEGSKTVMRSFALAREDERRGFLAGDSKSVDLEFLKWVPKDVASVSTSNLDIQGLYDGLVGAVKAYNPEMADMLLGQLAEQEKQFGLSLKDDLFAVFGDQMVNWSMGVSSFMSAPEGAMLLKVRDQDRLLGTLKKLAAMTGGMIDFPVSERRGVKTWRLELDPMAVPEEVAAGLQMLQPCFAFKDGYMVLALSTGDVRRTIKRMGRESDPATDIRSNKEFAGYLASIQQQNVSSFAWTDWKVTFESMYSAGTSALALLVSDEDVPFNMTLLPEAESLSQHLFSSMAYSTTSKDGFITTATSPLGPELMIGVGGAALAGALTWASVARSAPALEAPQAVDEARPVATPVAAPKKDKAKKDGPKKDKKKKN